MTLIHFQIRRAKIIPFDLLNSNLFPSIYKIIHKTRVQSLYYLSRDWTIVAYQLLQRKNSFAETFYSLKDSQKQSKELKEASHYRLVRNSTNSFTITPPFYELSTDLRGKSCRSKSCRAYSTLPRLHPLPVPQQVRPLKSEIANCESLKSDLLKY
jgi:hypothetical protein